MVFSSVIFLFVFFPIVLFGDILLRRIEYRNIFLLLASLVFFSWLQPQYLWVLIVSIFINWGFAIGMEKSNAGIRKNLCLFFAIIANILLLFFFKYFNFVLRIIGGIIHRDFKLLDFALPIGISFFTFQGLSYVIDVHRGKVRAKHSILDFALYLSLFPQLIAGPIVRYADVEKQIVSRKKSFNDVYYGIERFICGLAKKVVIANSLAYVVDQIWGQGALQISTIQAWLCSIAYTLQIYFDFSGYSDMAIGIGYILGFHFIENFNYPYVSKSITEFWRRWHMSLSSWFRDYVYIPLGGNQKRVYVNLAIVFLLTGLWHGAEWNFVVWGGWNGLFVIIERLFKNKVGKADARNTYRRAGVIISSIGKGIYTLFVVNMGWVLFRADTLDDAISFAKTMFLINNAKTPRFDIIWYLNRWNIIIFFLAITFSTPYPVAIFRKLKGKVGDNFAIICKNGCLIILFAISIIRIVCGTYNPFIYFRF